MPRSAFGGHIPASGAKQFMPFAALKGYEELIHQQEVTSIERHELNEEEIEAISIELAALSKKDIVKVVHYKSGAYVTTEGEFEKIAPEFQYLIVSGVKISFQDIYEITRL